MCSPCLTLPTFTTLVPCYQCLSLIPPHPFPCLLFLLLLHCHAMLDDPPALCLPLCMSYLINAHLLQANLPTSHVFSGLFCLLPTILYMQDVYFLTHLQHYFCHVHLVPYHQCPPSSLAHPTMFFLLCLSCSMLSMPAALLVHHVW